MKMSGRPAALLLIGLGLGAIVGFYLHAAAVWTGLGLAAVGVVVVIATGPRASDDLADPAAAPDAQTGRPARERPTLAGLGNRVEQILQLAEEQANKHRAESKREAEGILADARAKAQAIIDNAQKQVSEDS